MGKHLLANKQTSADKLENIRAPSRKHVLADEPGGGHGMANYPGSRLYMSLPRPTWHEKNSRTDSKKPERGDCTHCSPHVPPRQARIANRATSNKKSEINNYLAFFIIHFKGNRLILRLFLPLPVQLALRAHQLQLPF